MEEDTKMVDWQKEAETLVDELSLEMAERVRKTLVAFMKDVLENVINHVLTIPAEKMEYGIRCEASNEVLNIMGLLDDYGTPQQKE